MPTLNLRVSLFKERPLFRGAGRAFYTYQQSCQHSSCKKINILSGTIVKRVLRGQNGVYRLDRREQRQQEDAALGR